VEQPSVTTQPQDRSTTITRTVSNLTGWFGSFPAILLSFVIVAVWFAFGFVVNGGFANDTFQLIINTGTTIVTFWMVFIIQNTQNRDGRAMQAKLDAQSAALRAIARHLDIDTKELLRGTVGLEDAPEEIIKRDQDRVRQHATAHNA